MRSKSMLQKLFSFFSKKSFNTYGYDRLDSLHKIRIVVEVQGTRSSCTR